MGWYYNPHTGGVKIPEGVKRSTEARILRYAEAHHRGSYQRLEVRFRGALCYIDVFQEPTEPDPRQLELRNETREQYMERESKWPYHLCRLRYFGASDRWSMAFYLYGQNKYEPFPFAGGKDMGTPEEEFESAAVFLQDSDDVYPPGKG